MTLLSLSYPGEHLTHEMRVVIVPASPEGVKILRDCLEHLAELKLRVNLPPTPTGQVWLGSQVDQRGDSEGVGGWGPRAALTLPFLTFWGVDSESRPLPAPTCAASPEMSPLWSPPPPHTLFQGYKLSGDVSRTQSYTQPITQSCAQSARPITHSFTEFLPQFQPQLHLPQ